VNGSSHLLVANSLGETWQAIPLDVQPLVPLPEEGRTGQFPNDLDAAGSRLYITNSGDNTVTLVDLPTGLVTGCIDAGTGTNPWEFFLDPSDANRGWLTTFLSGELLELDLNALTVTRRITVGPGTEGLWVTDSVVVVTRTGYNGAINEYGPGSVVVYDKATLTEIARREVPPNAQFVFEGADHRIHVVCTGNYVDVTGRVARIDPAGWSVVDTLVLGGTPGRAILAPDGNAYLAGFFGGLLSYDTVTFQAVHDSADPILDEVGLGGLAIAGGSLFVTNFDADAVRVVQLSDGADLGSVDVGDGPVAVATAP